MGLIRPPRLEVCGHIVGRIAQNWEGFLQWSRFVQKASGDARSDAGNRGEQKRPRSE